MKHTSKYLVIGGGMTADAAVHGIREVDKSGTITVLSIDTHAPYNRPPLTKKLWAGKPLESIWRDTEAASVELHLDTRAVAGDPETKTICDSNGDTHNYEKLLLATGGVPRRLPFADDGVIYFRTLDDYQRVRALADRKAEFIVIGAGFIGSEIAAALANNGCSVRMIFPEQGIGSRIFPAALSASLNSAFAAKGVTLLPGESVSAIERTGERMEVRTGGGAKFSADAVIAGLGITPDTALAESLGLTVNNGIVVDKYLHTNQNDILAAGDVANFYCPALAMRRRVEHEDNANTMGTIAGHNMAGRPEIYEHLPYFYSDLFDAGYEAVGEIDSKLDVVEDWADEFHKGVLYYLLDNRVRGVLLWNTWDHVDDARKLIRDHKTWSRQDLVGRIGD